MYFNKEMKTIFKIIKLIVNGQNAEQTKEKEFTSYVSKRGSTLVKVLCMFK